MIPTLVRTGRTTPFGFALVLAATSGAAALMHELLWTRRLVDLLGASTDSETRVLGCFFVGLALGAALAQRLWVRIERPWRVLAGVELAIAAATLPALTLPAWTDWLWPALGPDLLVGWPGDATKLAASVLVIMPPAFLSGMTLPLMGKAVLVGERRFARHGTWIYAINTAGGVGGLVLATTITLPALGVVGSMGVALSLNVAVAAAAYAASWRESQEDKPEPGPEISVSWSILAVSAFSGAGVLALEILVLDLLRQVVPASIYGMNAVLVATLLSLAGAAAVVPILVRSVRAVRTMLSIALAATALAIVAVPLVFVRVTHGLRQMEGVATLFAFELEVIGLSLAVAGPALFLAGVVLPTVFAWLSIDRRDVHGRWWGAVLAANGIGGMLGAELTHRLLVPIAGFYVSAGVLASAYAIAALLLGSSIRVPRLRLACTIAAAAALALVVGATAVFLPRLPDMWEGLRYRVLSREIGREGLVAVVEHETRGRGITMNGSYFLGGTGDEHAERRQGHLPLLLHPHPKDVLFIGLATGLTAVAALDHPSVEQVSAVELSELVVGAAREHFADVSGAIHTSPRARVVVEDGRTFVAAAPAQFDVVVSDLFLPWRGGVGRLYSVEHLEGVRVALRPGGVFVQWLPAHQLTRQQLDVVLASVAEVFPQVFLFRGSFATAAMPLAVVALGDDRALDWGDLEARCRRLREAGVLDPLMRHAEGLGLLYLGPLRRDRLDDVTVNTLGNAWLELDAGQRRVTGNRADHYLAGERWAAAEPDLTLPGPPPSQPSLDLADLMARGRAIVGLPRNRKLNAAEKVKLRADVIDDFPDVMLRDDEVDWEAAPVLRQLLAARKRLDERR